MEFFSIATLQSELEHVECQSDSYQWHSHRARWTHRGVHFYPRTAVWASRIRFRTSSIDIGTRSRDMHTNAQGVQVAYAAWDLPPLGEDL